MLRSITAKDTIWEAAEHVLYRIRFRSVAATVSCLGNVSPEKSPAFKAVIPLFRRCLCLCLCLCFCFYERGNRCEMCSGNICCIGYNRHSSNNGIAHFRCAVSSRQETTDGYGHSQYPLRLMTTDNHRDCVGYAAIGDGDRHKIDIFCLIIQP